jgi:hypothetical protein
MGILPEKMEQKQHAQNDDKGRHRIGRNQCKIMDAVKLF